MKGFSHTVTGLTIGATVATFAPIELDPIARLNIIFVCGGAALMPDLDHGGATVSTSLGPITKVVSTAVNTLSGGHRKGTHSIFGWIITSILAYLLCLLSVDSPVWLEHITGSPTFNLGFIILAAFLWGISGAALGQASIALAAVGAITALTSPIPALYAGIVVFLGTATHSLLGDMLTTAGVPLLYPLSARSHRIWLLGDTGSMRENVYVAIMGIAAIAIPIYGIYTGLITV